MELLNVLWKIHYIKMLLNVLKQQGAEIVEIEEEELGLPNFVRLLNLDMKKDLPAYMENYANDRY